MPTGQMTTDVDDYISAWRKIAKPIEQTLGVTLHGFDPGFQFHQGNAQNSDAQIVNMPLWFAKSLSDALIREQKKVTDTTDVMYAVQEQFVVHGNNFPDGFDSRVFRWVDDTVAGLPPNLRS